MGETGYCYFALTRELRPWDVMLPLPRCLASRVERFEAPCPSSPPSHNKTSISIQLEARQQAVVALLLDGHCDGMS